MNNFLKSIRSTSDTKEKLIKKSIITQLSENIKEIQLCGLEEKMLAGDSLDIGDAANNLCSIIEAIFLHGLKDSLVHKARRVIGNDIDQRPEPSFLSPLLIISHRQIIEQISSLPNITTEIGQCRAWIRISLNDSLLSSYLALMMKDLKSVMPFYKSFAFLRDTDLLDIARKLVESVEVYNIFMLPFNSSLFNHWPLPTLLLAGIWSPPLRQCPITSGIDVAQSLDNISYLKANEANSPSNSVLSVTSHSSELGKMLALNEDEALKIILASTEPNELPTNKKQLPIVDQAESPQKVTQNSSSTESFKSPESQDTEQTFDEPSSLGNSLNRQSGWSFDDSRNETTATTPQATPNLTKSISIDGAKSNEHSYHALIESYNLVSGPESKVPNLQEVWERFGDSRENSLESCEGRVSCDAMNIDDLFGFEFISASTIDKSDVSFYLSQIGKLAQEKGLDNQNYECFGCKHPLGISLCKPRICAFTGDCYCDSCMSPESIMIPARVLHNWDFKQYYVSKKIVMFLNEIKNHPVLDLKILNPYIYKGVEEMAKLESLRIQLNYLRDYLFTCREPVIEKFKRLGWPKEYMYEHIHQYSIADLSQITGGILAQQLQKMVDFGREHVVKCWLCSQKGFVCEVCKKPKILYPFDVESTYRCEICSAVYHTNCLDFTKPCPKCKRRQERQERQELSLLEATLE